MAAANAPGDYRKPLLQAAAHQLARTEWRHAFSPTADFVTYVTGEDEGPDDQYASMILANPAGPLRARARHWPDNLAYPPKAYAGD
jgi:hypothetical protein